ncbi:unnamed protein product [Debaryomyces fabryi]|nr:unnamed protein product [Debaryomyces fabryi]
MKYWYVSVPLCLLVAYSLYGNVGTLASDDTTCDLVNHTNYCQYIGKNCNTEYFSIASKYYCSKYYPSNILRLTTSLVILTGLLLLLISLSLLVSNYLFPNLNDIALLLFISDQILSSILLPSTNAFGDFINYYVALNANSVDLVLGQLLGSLLIIITVIIGLICILCPFRVNNSKWILTDFAWILVVLVLLLYNLSDGIITMTESIIMIGFYFCYVAYLLRAEKEIECTEDECHSLCSTGSVKSMNHALNIDDALDILSNAEIIRSPSPMHQIDEELDAPIEFENWFLNVLRHIVTCINLIFSFLIPVTSSPYYDSRLFQIWHFCIISYIINMQFFKIALVDLIPIILVGVLITEFIKPILNRLPKLYQCIINIVGIGMSLIIMSQISTQVLKVFKNLGIILRISDYLLGLVVFSISNSINDIVTDITVSTTVNPIFGLNSCLGTPMLITLLGIGVNGLILNLSHHSLVFELKINLVVSLLGAIATVIFYLIYIPLNNWKLDKRLGIIVIGWWLLITIVNFSLG